MIRWSTIRMYEGSQEAAFEELCAQLARHEPGMPPGSTYVRKGRPDAGVECFWRTPAGDETAWQAKYFLSTPTSGQWRQCDESVRRALVGHPDLTRYVICFAVDLPDGRRAGVTTARAQWNKRVARWSAWARDRGMDVEFELWDGSALTDRLARREHRGRVWFWFKTEAMSPDWFGDQLKPALADLDRRYRSELHVNVRSQVSLDALVGAESAAHRLRELARKVRDRWMALRSDLVEAWAGREFSAAKKALQGALDQSEGIRVTSVHPAQLAGLASSLAAGGRALAQLEAAVVTPLADDDKQQRMHAWHKLRELESAHEALQEYVEGPLHFAEEPFMVLVGAAGMGKSHLVAHVARECVRDRRPAILMLGGYFQPGDPWAQVATHLGLQGQGADEFLGAMQAAAEASGRRAVLVIDALNEWGAEVHQMWRSRLAGMRAKLAKFPAVALVVTVRSPFEEAVLPRVLQTGPHLVRHEGLVGRVGVAVTHFLEAFRLPPPRVPLLLPEFSNPLFLVLYCETLRSRRDRSERKQPQGFVAILDAWLEEAGRRAARRMDTDPGDRLLHRGVEVLARAMAGRVSDRLPRDTAKQLLAVLTPSTRFGRSLFKALIDESVIVEVPLSRGGVAAVRFQYERMHDFVVARAGVQLHLEGGGALADFGAAPFVRGLLDRPRSGAGLLQALAVVLPTQHRVELVDLVREDEVDGVLPYVIAALPELPADRIVPAVVDLVRDQLDVRDYQSLPPLLDSLLLVSAEPGHPLNARFLDAWLREQTLHDRDARWSAATLCSHDGHGFTSGRLLDWTDGTEALTALGREARYLLGVALGWLLTSPHRPLRDRATKALVRLFQSDLETMRRWLADMQAVNDLYVVERALAAAYGAVLRTDELSGLGDVARLVYAKWFAPGPPPLHLLARDYARNIVEFAAARGETGGEVDLEAVRPRYTSEWVEPTETRADLELQFGGQSRVVASMVDGGDFDRYSLGSNSWRFDWLGLRPGDPEPPGADAVIDEFQRSLKATQREAWRGFLAVRSLQDDVRVVCVALRSETLREEHGAALDASRSELSSILGVPIEEAHEADLVAGARRIHDAALHRLRGALSDVQLDEFNSRVSRALDGRYERVKSDFPLELAHRWLLDRVLRLGWKEDTLGAIDRERLRPYAGRTGHKVERLGKKYQWIALHGFLASVSDHFVYRRDEWAEGDAEYKGPWQSYRRDIDPSCLLRSTQAERFDMPRTWWNPVAFDPARGAESDEQWLTAPRSLPDPRTLLEVARPTPGKVERWTPLDLHVEWDEPVPIGLAPVRLEQRSAYYWISGYLVAEDDCTSMLNWARSQQFFGRWMPGVAEVTPRLMLRERSWSPAWKHFASQPGGPRDWTTASDGPPLPHPVLVTWDYYMAEGTTHDTSIEDGYTLHLLAPRLQEILELLHADDGHFVDRTGHVAAFDPSIAEAGPGALLLRRDQVDRLKEHGLNLIWTLFGEQFLRDHSGVHPGRVLGGTELSGAFTLRDAGWEGTLRGVPRGIGERDRSDDQFVITYRAGVADADYSREPVPTPEE